MTVVALIVSGMPSSVTVNRTMGVDASVTVERDVTDLPSIYIPPCTAQALSKQSDSQHSWRKTTFTCKILVISHQDRQNDPLERATCHIDQQSAYIASDEQM